MRLDKEKAKNFVLSEIEDETKLIDFLKLFISYSYSQSSGDYGTRKNKKYNYDGIASFIDIESIAHRVKGISLSIDSDTEHLTKYAIESFLTYPRPG